MTSTQTQFKTALLSKQQELNSRAIGREEIAIEKHAEALDEIQENAERALTLSMMNRNWEMNNLIHQALEKLDTGMYGICEECEEEISAKRLAAVPWAKFCIGCQEKADRSTKTETEQAWRLAA